MSDSAESAEENLLKRHRVESKELQAKIQKLKKSVNKDKKRKKEVQNEIASLEKDLKDRHASEIAELERENISDMTDTQTVLDGVASIDIKSSDNETNKLENGFESSDEIQPKERRISKAEKRRVKKALASKEREAMIKEAEKMNRFSARNVEADKIKTILKERGLQMYEIIPDGNCLYAAISHQLKPHSSVQELRSLAACYIRTHQDDFLPFITDPSSNELLSPAKFEEYCFKLENSAVWGGQPELCWMATGHAGNMQTMPYLYQMLRALSQALKTRIEVLQAEGSPIIFGEEMKTGKNVLLAYYRHYYGLGEHYNSTEPLKLKSNNNIF